MHHVRQGDLPFVGSSHEFIGAEQGILVFRYFFFMGSRGRGRGRIGIPMTRFSSSAKAVECGL